MGERKAPQEWIDTILIPIPKKGNLTICDNWRGISVLDVVGKVVVRINQMRLQSVAESELSESQCGFWKGQRYTDMFFTVRQLVEKAVEHGVKEYFVFVDLNMAYNSVPGIALWMALKKMRVPDQLVNIV